MCSTPEQLRSSKETLEEWGNDKARVGSIQTLSIEPMDDTLDRQEYQDLIDFLLQFFEGGRVRLQNFQTLK